MAILLPLPGWAEERVAWTASKVQGSPEPPAPYTAEVIWPHISFDEGLDITLLESEERMFITERYGKIWMLPADLSANPEKAELVCDLKQFVPEFDNAYGLTFHPNFPDNRQLFVFYIVGITDEEMITRVSRFRMDDHLKIIPASEEIIISFDGGGHNGGDVQFGPDGLLYFPIGDLASPSPPDPYNEGQKMSTLASTIVRIDIDHQDSGLAYHIPEDNPFVGIEGIRPEIWAFGFRNPWKMCFDPEYGDIWTGDVGWEMWEMVYRVEKGGNYGWSIMEGPSPTKMNQPRGPTPISPPAVYYPHTEGASITGGFFVTSPQYPDLKGAYIYGDWVTGKVWALNWDGRRVVKNELIAETGKQIVTFGQDLNGNLIFMDYPNNCRLYRLVPNSKTDADNNFPRRLSETGIFRNVETEETYPGVYSFSIRAPMWQDGYRSRYWIGMPGEGGLVTEVIEQRETPLIRYETPANTVVVKTIHSDEIRIETQIFYFDGYWIGYTY
ncbi:MAG: PQQ-dependent sugar dehydrogenase [Verrucomicrobia bacterium]|nr:PQQ-dependent sugar dehydrogenase [Verrucomicrobiota bacterium]